MGFADLPKRFSVQGRHTFDHWQGEKLNRVTVPNTPENYHFDFIFYIVIMEPALCKEDGIFQQHEFPRIPDTASSNKEVMHYEGLFLDYNFNVEE